MLRLSILLLLALGAGAARADDQSALPEALGAQVSDDPQEAPRPGFVVITRRHELALATAVGFNHFAGNARQVDAPFSSLWLSWSYDLRFGAVRARPGLALFGMSIGYDQVATRRSHRSWIGGALAQLALERALSPRWAAGLRVGTGVATWAGLGEGNPFTDRGVAATGAIPMPAFTVALELRRRLFDRWVAAIGPRYLVLAPTNRPLAAATSRLDHLTLALSLGLHL